MDQQWITGTEEWNLQAKKRYATSSSSEQIVQDISLCSYEGFRVFAYHGPSEDPTSSREREQLHLEGEDA